MRRADREVVGLDNLLAILDRCEVMRLGLCLENRPYIVPMNFAYQVMDGTLILYFHCAKEGRKLQMIAQNSAVCFEADCSYKTLPADRLCGWSAEYESVMGEGIVDIAQDEKEIAQAMDIFMKRHGYAGEMRLSANEIASFTLLRLTVASITGKRHIKNPG